MSTFSTPTTVQERVELAQQLYQLYYTQCFWHCPRDLVITEEVIPFVIKGLRTEGDRRAFILSGKLKPPRVTRSHQEVGTVMSWGESRMPLTDFQKKVAHLLAANRNPESYVAGGAAINRADSSHRFSEDLDIFHDVAESVAFSAEADAKVLEHAHYGVQWVHRHEGHYRAVVTSGSDSMRLDWTNDSAFRFFPVEKDADFGYCLHRADLATNKLLALAGRSEIRDFLDILLIDQEYLSLGAMVWAACGKDPGFTPSRLLNYADRHTRYQEPDLKGETLARPVDFKELKNRWLAARERAEQLIARLPEEEVGQLYLDQQNNPVTPDPDSPEFPALRRHAGSVRGAWPRIS